MTGDLLGHTCMVLSPLFCPFLTRPSHTGSCGHTFPDSASLTYCSLLTLSSAPHQGSEKMCHSVHLKKTQESSKVQTASSHGSTATISESGTDSVMSWGPWLSPHPAPHSSHPACLSCLPFIGSGTPALSSRCPHKGEFPSARAVSTATPVLCCPRHLGGWAGEDKATDKKLGATQGDWGSERKELESSTC